MLVNQPGLVRVRLELARAFFLKSEDDLARQHFEQVLAGDLPPPVAANVRAFLNQIRARKRWSFNLGFALAPDSNIGAGSEERTIYIFGLPFQRDAEELTTSGIGVAVWGGAEYQVPVAERLRLRAGGSFSRREYEGSQFDQLFLAGHAGPRWFVDRETEASLLASARQRWLGTAPEFRDLGARLEVGRRVSQSVKAFAQASWHGRRYKTLVGAQMRYAVHDRNGWPIAMLGFSTAAWKLAPRDSFIGWTPRSREKNLPLVVDNPRFLILPWITIPNLGSHILALIRRRLPPGLGRALQHNARAHRDFRRDPALHWRRLQGLRLDPRRDHPGARALRPGQAVRQAEKGCLAPAPATGLETNTQSLNRPGRIETPALIPRPERTIIAPGKALERR